jgi:putative ABC transport system substrate-binding protein
MSSSSSNPWIGGRLGNQRTPWMAAGPAGGLISYAPDYVDLHRRAAVCIDKILKGAKPGELPVEQASRFQLIINLKTARTLGLTIPTSILARPDEVMNE